MTLSPAFKEVLQMTEGRKRTMPMKKKIISILLALIISLFFTIPTYASASSTNNAISWDG